MARVHSTVAAAGLAFVLAASGCTNGDAVDDATRPTLPDDIVTGENADGTPATIDATDLDAGTSGAEPVTVVGGLTSAYLGDYRIESADFGTMTTVSVTNGVRTIRTNALPDHDTGDFPNDGNPNAISAQALVWEYPAEPTVLGEPTEVGIPGVALNGVKFEPATAETVQCSSGETYRVEALQQLVDLGLDVNNAHVQPTGEYHYHGVSALLVEAYGSDDDLVHIGFAADGHLVVFSKSGAFTPGWSLSTDPRTGDDCVLSLPGTDPVAIEGTMPDGTYGSDWVFAADTGDLDECNGTTVDGTFVYVATETYPYLPRCLMGEPAADARPVGDGSPTDDGAGGGGSGAGGGDRPPGPPPGG